MRSILGRTRLRLNARIHSHVVYGQILVVRVLVDVSHLRVLVVVLLVALHAPTSFVQHLHYLQLLLDVLLKHVVVHEPLGLL